MKFNVSKKDIKLTLNKYKKQCDVAFGKKIITDDGFQYALAIGVKNNNFPFLQYIIDIYQTYCIQYALKDQYRSLSDITFSDWARKQVKLHN